jgi:cysteine desulfurase
MGMAAKLAVENFQLRRDHLLALRDRLIRGLQEKISDCFLTGHPADRLPGHASFCVKFVEGEAMLLHLNFAGIGATSGSTCSSQALKVSHVLEAIKIDALWAQGSVVFTLGLDNTVQEVDTCLEELAQAVERLRKMSPLVGAEDLNRFRYRKG